MLSDDSGTSPHPAQSGDQSPADEPLTVLEFIDDDECAAPTPPAPGLPGAILWFIATLCMHGIGTTFAIALLIFLALVRGTDSAGLPGDQAPAAMPSTAISKLLTDESSFWTIVGGEQIIVVLLTVIAIYWWYGPRWAARLQVRWLKPLHIIIILGMIFPLSYCCGTIYSYTQAAWAQLPFEQQKMFGAEANEMVAQHINSSSLLYAILFLSICPAISEELVFRGIIAQGLTARYRWWGACAAAGLFALLHMHPVHVISVLPVGVILHWVYFTTRSFAAPVLLHFLNNTLATVVMNLGDAEVANQVDITQPRDSVLLGFALLAVVLGGILLWQTRCRYISDNDDHEWNPGWLTVAAPKGTLNYRESHGRVSRGLFTAFSIATLGMIVFPALVTAWNR